MARRRDDDEDEDDRPRAKRRRDEDDEDDAPRPKKKPRPADDEDEDDRPRKKARAAAEDDDEEEDERPKKRYQKPKGMSKGLLFGLIGVGVAVIVGGIVLVLMLSGGNSPKSALEKMVKAAEAKDYGTFYDGFDKKSQEVISGMMGMVAAFDPKLKGKTGKDLFVAAAASNEGKKGGTGPMSGTFKVTVLSEKVTGDKATLQVKNEKGVEESITMVKEDGKWKLSIIDKMGGMPDMKMPDMKMPDFKMPDFKMPDGKDFPKFEFPK